MKKLLFAILAAASFAASATTFNWKWCVDIGCTVPGATVAASGSLTTAGDATTPEPIESITGEIRGHPILGLVPLGTDHRFSYDNLFHAGDPVVTLRGILVDLGGGVVDQIYNGGFFYPAYFEYLYAGEPVTINGGMGYRVYIDAAPVRAIPEPASILLMLTGMTFFLLQMGGRRT